MKIVFLNPAAHGGGAEVALHDLLCALREVRPQWVLHLVTAEDGPLLEKCRAIGVSSEVLGFGRALRAAGDAAPANTGSSARPNVPSKLSRVLSKFPALAAGALSAWHYRGRLRRRLMELRPDLIHSNGMKMHLLAALAKPAPSIPLVWHLHDYVSTRPAMAPVLKALSARCQLAVANSQSVGEDAARVFGAQPPVRTVLNSVDAAVFTPEGERLDLDALCGLAAAAAGTVRIGLVATFAFWKGHHVFLKAAARAIADAPGVPVRFYIIGGPLYATPGSQFEPGQLRAFAAELGVEVGFSGFVDKPAAAMRALDIVVHASTQPEPFGLVIIQAMACGRAVVASDAGGARELVSAGVDGLLHGPGDEASLAAAMVRLTRDAALRERLGRAGRLKALNAFSRTKMAERIVPLYEGLLG